MEQTPSVRNAVIDDVQRLFAFLQPFAEQELILPRSMEDLRTLVGHGFIAEIGAEVIGFAAIEIYSRKLAEVQSLAVDPRHQRKGIGRQLVERCVARARDEGVLELMAITTSDELFRGSGFDYSLPNQKRALFLQTKSNHP